MWSVCLDWMISAFFMVFTHRMAESFFLRASLTFPKDPEPRSVSMLKSDKFKTLLIFSFFPSITQIKMYTTFPFLNQTSYQYLQYKYKTTNMAHHGYEKDRFTSLGFDEFDCIICCQVAMDPMECDSCGKIFCKICISDWISKNSVTKCPNRCNSQIVPIRSKALLKVYKNLDIKCANSACNKILKLSDLEKHESMCLRPKCWNFDVCEKPVSEAFKASKPCCSPLCELLLNIVQNMKNIPKMYQIINGLGSNVPIIDTKTNNKVEILGWDGTKCGSGIVVSQNNSHAFLKEQAYIFKSIVANIGFTSGINYWEIIADTRTENQLKIGICTNKNFDMNSAFSDHPGGWAYYGLGQLRNASNATGSAYGKKFKRDGILGVCLNMVKGTLSFSLNGENMGVAFQDEKLKSGIYYPAVGLLHCAGCKIRGGLPIPQMYK